jgi:hypothetical protein
MGDDFGGSRDRKWRRLARPPDFDRAVAAGKANALNFGIRVDGVTLAANRFKRSRAAGLGIEKPNIVGRHIGRRIAFRGGFA